MFLLSIASTSVFSLSQAIPLSLILTGIYMGKRLLCQGNIILKINYFIPLLLMFFVFMSALYNSPSMISSKPINHALSFFVCLFVYYPCTAIIINSFGLKKISSIFMCVFQLCFILTVIEFISVNYLGGNVLGFLPRPASEFDYEPLAYSFIRARGLAEESGHWALISILLFSMSQAFNEENKSMDFVIKIIVLIELLLIIFFTFSVSGFISVSLSGLIAPFLSPVGRKIKIGMLIFFMLMFLILFYALDYYLGITVIDVFLNKMTGISGVERAEKISETLTLLFDGSVGTMLLGLGPAFYDTYHLKTVVSFVFLILFEFGLVGFTFMVIFMMWFFRQAIKTKSPAILFGSISLLVYSVAISNYWFQIVWFYISIVIGASLRIKEKTDRVGL